jgi:hypothetical protein
MGVENLDWIQFLKNKVMKVFVNFLLPIRL